MKSKSLVWSKRPTQKPQSKCRYLTLTATPIPRTLQFSLMNAREDSIINTPPQNRFPVETIVQTFLKRLFKKP